MKVARKMAIVNPGKASPSLKSESQGSYIEKASKKDEDLRAMMFANKERATTSPCDQGDSIQPFILESFHENCRLQLFLKKYF